MSLMYFVPVRESRPYMLYYACFTVREAALLELTQLVTGNWEPSIGLALKLRMAHSLYYIKPPGGVEAVREVGRQ